MVEKVTDTILNVGVNDYDIKIFENQYILEKGMAYNSYVILDEKVAVMDTVDEHVTEEWLVKVDEALLGRSVDYLVVQHMEPDHSGSIMERVRGRGQRQHHAVLDGGGRLHLQHQQVPDRHAGRRPALRQLHAQAHLPVVDELCAAHDATAPERGRRAAGAVRLLDRLGPGHAAPGRLRAGGPAPGLPRRQAPDRGAERQQRVRPRLLPEPVGHGLEQPLRRAAQRHADPAGRVLSGRRPMDGADAPSILF